MTEKILLISPSIAPSSYGGVQTYVREIYNRIKKKNIEIKVICIRTKKKLHDNNIIQINTPNIRFLGIFLFSVKAYIIIKKFFSDYKLYSCASRSGLTLIFLKKPFVTAIHDIGALIYPGNILEKFLRRIAYTMVCRKTKKIIVPSLYTKNGLLEFFPFLKNRIILNYYGINTDFFKPVSKKKKKDKTILYVGRIAENKGIDTLLQAYKLLKKKEKNIKLVIVGGPTPTTKKSFELIRNKNPDVIFLGEITPGDEKLRELYSEASVFVYPSKFSEGFGLPIGEAMSCGTQVVASDLPCFKEVGGDYTYYFRVGDVDDLKDKIKKALRNPFSAELLRNSIIKRFSWDDNVRKLLNIINSS